jgi:ParB family transcriptional regulator, chromosome partitioning protein
MAHNIGHYEKIRAITGNARLVVLGGVRAGAHSQITIYDRVSNKRLHSIDVAAHVLGLAMGGESIAAACSDGVVRVYRATGEHVADLAAHAGPAAAVAFFPDGNSVASAGADGALRVHAVSSKKRLHDWQLSAQPLRAVAVDPGGEYAAGAGDDGLVRIVTVATGARREMSGHDGPVNCLAFTPRDGRIVSGGDDGVLRLYYLVGDTDSEVRGSDDSGHVGAVRAVAFSPTPAVQKDGTEPGDKFFSAGDDGKIKAWRLADRRKPKTLDTGSQPLLALAHVAQASGTGLGFVATGGDSRSLYLVSLDATGTPSDAPATLGHGFQPLAEALTGNAQRPPREAAVKALSALEEPEATELLIKTLSGDRFPEVRALAAIELGGTRRREARVALRAKLGDADATVRLAAYEALQAIDHETPLSTPRAALDAPQADIRVRALGDLAALHGASPLVGGLIAGKLTDVDRNVRLAALDRYTSLFPAGSTEPLRAAFERGPTDLRVEVLVRAALGGLSSQGEMEAVFTHAFDDAESDVRRTAFAIKVLERPALAAALEGRDEGLARAISELARQAARSKASGPQPAKPKDPGEEELKQARATLVSVLAQGKSAGGALDEGDLTPLLLAMACRTADTALRGARGLAELGDTRALGALLQLSREGDKNIRREAARALQALSDPRAKKRLVWMLDDADADVRTAALEAYTKLERSALFLAEAALRSSQQDIRVRGLNLLVKQGSGSAETDALLGDALEDEAPQVRTEAFKTLWSWHDKDPEKAIARALEARFPDLRLRAVTELEANGKEGWALVRLEATVGDRDAQVSQAAYDALVKLRGKADATAYLVAMASLHPTVRAAGAKGAWHAEVEKVRGPLMKQLADADPAARSAALASLDKALPKEAGPLYAALQSSFYDLKVQAAELLSERRDEQIIDAMRAFLSDKELSKVIPADALRGLRFAASRALASLGSPRLLKYFATELLKDDDGHVREQAARGLSTSSRKGDEGFLLDALGHQDVAVRSWAAEGLSRLGDARALPVLTGHLRHEHQPVRVGAILSFAALGPEGYGGMLQGLEDASKEVQEIVFMLILARDLRAFRRGESPDLLTSALSSQRSEVRFAAARALELRSDPASYLAHLIEALMPPKPEKASDMKDWPTDERRGRIMVGLAEALAGDRPELRYAAAQALQLRRKPSEFFREAQSLAKPRLAGAAIIPETAPRAAAESDTKAHGGWLRRLFAEGVEGAAPAEVADDERHRLRWLAFGAYVGLLRQVTTGDDEGHRVRRDAIDRIVDLTQHKHVSTTASMPALVRALDDPNYLVRRSAFAGVKKLFDDGADEPLTLALGSSSDDVARAALDELAARGEQARPRIAAALNARLAEVRKYAFELLERLSPKGSLEPLIAALESDHADMRIGVIERLATSHDARVVSALVRAMLSDHEDLRLRAAELLAVRHDDRSADVLATFLRSDNAGVLARARQSLTILGSVAAVKVIANRLEDAPPDERVALVGDLGRTRNAEAIDVLTLRFSDEAEAVRQAAFEAALNIAGVDRKKRDLTASLRFLRVAVRSRDAALRLKAVGELDHGDEAGQSELLVGLFSDRDAPTRISAVASYSTRVQKKGAPPGPLEHVLALGARELMLAAAEGVASQGGALAFRPLLLFVRAGEPGERERALLGLGALGDVRGLAELETVAAGGTPEAPVEPTMVVAAFEALGRIHNKLTDTDAKAKIVERLEGALGGSDDELTKASLRGLRWIGGERARSKIEESAVDRRISWQCRAEAVDQLAELLDPASEATLAKALSDDDNDVRAHARKALDKVFPSERTRVEFLALASTESDMSEPAATYLAEEGDAGLLLPRLGTLEEELRRRLRFGLLRRAELPPAPLEKLLEGDAAAGRESAAWLIGGRAGDAGAKAPPEALLKALIASEALTAKRWAAASNETRGDEASAWERLVWALRCAGAQGGLGRARVLAQGTDSAAPAAVRREALHLIERLGKGKEDETAAAAALRDGDPSVRAAAASALGQLAPARSARVASEVQPFDAVAFSAGGAEATTELLATSTGRQILLPRLLAARDATALLAALSQAPDEASRLDLIAAAGGSGDARAATALRAIAFDKKAFDAETRKAAYRALRRVGRRVKKHPEAQP